MASMRREVACGTAGGEPVGVKAVQARAWRESHRGGARRVAVGKIGRRKPV